MRLTPEHLQVYLYTSREGNLKAIGHDLKLSVERFWVDIESKEIEAGFEASSIRVLGNMVGDTLKQNVSQSDKKKIKKSLESQVLKASKFPMVRFKGTICWDDLVVGGTLTLCGVERDVQLNLRMEDDMMVGSSIVNQTDFGIKQFSALLGQLKVHPEVRVELIFDSSLLDSLGDV